MQKWRDKASSVSRAVLRRRWLFPPMNHRRASTQTHSICCSCAHHNVNCTSPWTHFVFLCPTTTPFFFCFSACSQPLPGCVCRLWTVWLCRLSVFYLCLWLSLFFIVPCRPPFCAKAQNPAVALSLFTRTLPLRSLRSSFGPETPLPPPPPPSLDRVSLCARACPRVLKILMRLRLMRTADKTAPRT